MNGLSEELGCNLNIGPDGITTSVPNSATTAPGSPTKKNGKARMSVGQKVTVAEVDLKNLGVPTVTTTTTTSPSPDHPKPKKNKKVAKKPVPADVEKDKSPSPAPSSEPGTPKNIPPSMANFRFTSTSSNTGNSGSADAAQKEAPLAAHGAAEEEAKPSPARALRVCSCCRTEEPKPKAYKKCLK